MDSSMDRITEEKLKHYFDITNKAFDKIKIAKPKAVDLEKTAKDFLDMAKRYYEDAKFFQSKGDYVNAYGALNYAYGWLDAGARLGIFDVDFDNQLFTVDKEMFE